MQKTLKKKKEKKYTKHIIHPETHKQHNICGYKIRIKLKNITVINYYNTFGTSALQKLTNIAVTENLKNPEL